MSIRRSAFVAGLLLVASAAAAQDNGQIEQQLKARYKDQPLVVNVSIRPGEITYDLNGEPVGAFSQTCGRPELDVKNVKVTDQEVAFYARGADRRDMVRSGPLRTGAQEKNVVLRIKGDGQPWDIARIEAALNAMSRRRPLRPLAADTPAWPKDAERPAPGADPRIVFVLPNGPVYQIGKGVIAVKGIETPDPTYTPAASRARAMGAVAFRLIVNEDGSVSDIRPASAPLGYGLDEQAARTLAEWRFQPAMLDGAPVKADVSVEMTFCLY